MIIAIHYNEPVTPIDSSFPDAIREKIGAVWVDYVGDRPTDLVRNNEISDKWDCIKAKRDQCKAGGVKVGTVNKWFHSDDASRIQQMTLAMMGANIPANLQWKTLDGSFVTMTQAVAQSVFAAAAASDQAIFAVAEGHRAALAACEDPASYDYSTGWPAIFGE